MGSSSLASSTGERDGSNECGPSSAGHTLRRACGDWAQADDLAQETFLAAWSRIGRLKAGASVRAWLCGIGYNKHLTAVRSAGRERARGAAYEADRDETIDATAEDKLALERAGAARHPS